MKKCIVILVALLFAVSSTIVCTAAVTYPKQETQFTGAASGHPELTQLYPLHAAFKAATKRKAKEDNPDEAEAQNQDDGTKGGKSLNMQDGQDKPSQQKNSGPASSGKPERKGM